METDIRAPPSEAGILINLHADAESGIEAKCLSINPIYPEYLAVGGSDSYIRMYDRRKLKCNVIQWPDSVADNPRDRRGYLKDKSCQDYDWSNQRFAKYFVAGHLPKATKKHVTNLWRRDNFTSTYVTFSPNGQELLANMGSEQIYLFDVFHGSPILKDSFAFKNFLLQDENPEKVKNGFHKKSKIDDLSPQALQLKMQANQEYEADRYSNAINLYNQALDAQVHPILLGNRAAAFLKRMWNGDIYSALLDVYYVILLDPSHIKAHLRLIKCLTELKWIEEAADFVVVFKQKFPNHADSPALKSLEKRLEEVKNDVKESESKNKKRKESSGDDVDNDKTVEPEVDKNEEFIVELDKLKVNATDFKLRFCGHCNTTTDIKEANFFGSEGNYIIAGSDDGKFFIWDRKTTNIIKVLQGDDSIVNCLQPHPTTCYLATSGIDPYVRIWAPMPDDFDNKRVIEDFDKTSSENQRRMNADPFESFFMEMGYRVRDMSDNDADNNEDDSESGSMQPCRTS